MQTITSANTSLHQIPALHKSNTVKEWLESLHPTHRIAVDIGCGKWPKDIGAYMRETYKCGYFPYDPYNMPEDTNKMTLDFIDKGDFYIATCANVLNVINDDEAMSQVILLAAVATLKVKGHAFFSVYEGDKSGIGKKTKNGYQRNQKTEDYLPYMFRWFTHVERHGKVIQAWN